MATEQSLAERAGLAAGALDGRLAIVTGAASGIGAATADLLLDLGASVVAIDRDAAGAPHVNPSRRFPITYDLAELDGIAALVDRICGEHGTPTILVNAAAIIGGLIRTTTRQQWDHVIAVDLTAPFLLVQAAGERIIENGEGGNIVNVGSSSAFRAVSSGAAYGAAKAGLASLTRGAAWEYGPHGVNVNMVAPGLTRTAITTAAFGDLARMTAAVQEGPLANLTQRVSEPDDVAAVIAFLCLPGSRQITGQVVHVSAGAVVAAG